MFGGTVGGEDDAAPQAGTAAGGEKAGAVQRVQQAAQHHQHPQLPVREDLLLAAQVLGGTPLQLRLQDGGAQDPGAAEPARHRREGQ